MPPSSRTAPRRCCSESLLLPNLLLVLLLPIIVPAAFLVHSTSTHSRSIATSSTTPRSPSPSHRALQWDRTRRATVVAAAVSSSSSTSSSTPPDLVDALAERPWRSGLEPAEDVDMLEVPVECIEVRTKWVCRRV